MFLSFSFKFHLLCKKYNKELKWGCADCRILSVRKFSLLIHAVFWVSCRVKVHMFVLYACTRIVKFASWNNIPGLSRYAPDGRLHIYKLDHCHSKMFATLSMYTTGGTCIQSNSEIGLHFDTARNRLKTNEKSFDVSANEFRRVY